MYDGGHGADQLPESLDRPAFAGDVDVAVRPGEDQSGQGLGGPGDRDVWRCELAAAADLLGGTAAAFHTAGAELSRRDEHALALRILDLGLLSHPGTLELLDLRQSILHRLVERNQLLNPFKFAYYAGLADLELAPPG
jgi:hypothetical protein